MRLLILLALFFTQSLWATETSKYILTQKAFDFLKVSEWIEYLKKVKGEEPIPPYFIFKEPPEKYLQYLNSYDLPSFEQGLNKKIAKLITEDELIKAMKVIKNPYFSKFFNDLHLFTANFNNINSLNSEDRSEINRFKLIESIYNLMSLKTIMQNEYKKYNTLVKNQKRLAELLENPDVETNSQQYQELTEDQFKNAFLVKLNNLLFKYKDSEIREIIRITKDEKELLKFISIVGTYSYFYMDKTKTLVDAKEKKKSSLGLK